MGGYDAAAAACRAACDPRAAIGALLHCDASEVALQESAQVGWTKAFYSLQLGPSDTMVTFESEYAGNAVAVLQQRARTGAALAVLPHLPSGVVDVEALRHLLADCTGSGRRCVVLLTHMNTGSAVIQPAAEVGSVARQFGAAFLLDACQTVGQVAVDVRAIGCDFACGTGRKWLRGPRGSGFLYARRGVTDAADAARAGGPSSLFGEPGMLDHVSGVWSSRQTYALAPGAKRFEMWEASEASRLGLGAAARLVLAITPERIHTLSSRLAAQLRRQLRAAVPASVMRDGSDAAGDCTQLGAIVVFEVRGIDSSMLAAALATRRISCTLAKSTHTFVEEEWARPSAIRLSPSYFNTEAEVEAVVEAVAHEVEKMRHASGH
jgi:selenocysteine lyase/cysteine desulfurase